VERGKIVFENGSENYQEAEKELDKNIAKALRQIEQRNAGLIRALRRAGRSAA
jgi:hypothetical protein